MTTFLLYMRKADDPAFTLDRSYDLYDELIDAGYTLKTIFMDIIMECLVVSGFISREDLDQAQEEDKTK
jgi:hypothetical protein